MSVLVTGGLGFIGAKVVIQLLKRDIPVIVADLDIEKNKVRLEENISKVGKDKKLVSYQKLEKKWNNLVRHFFSEFWRHLRVFNACST